MGHNAQARKQLAVLEARREFLKLWQQDTTVCSTDLLSGPKLFAALSAGEAIEAAKQIFQLAAMAQDSVDSK